MEGLAMKSLTLNRAVSSLGAAALLTACAPAATAQAPGAADARLITVSGEGRAAGEPDVAIINLGVEARRPTAVDAMAAVNAAAASVLDALKGAGVAREDIQTDRISVTAQYDYRSQQRGEQPRLTGYLAANSVSAKVREIDRAGPVIDAAIGAGANNLDGISFAFDDPAPLLNEARRSAVEDALAKAELYANAAGVKAGRVVEISDVAAARAPGTRIAAMRAEADASGFAPTPVEPGELSLTAQVIVTMEIE